MSDDPVIKSWWQTVPGLLTATAAILTAITGLILALNQVGLIGGSASTPGEVAFPSNDSSGVRGPDPVMPLENNASARPIAPDVSVAADTVGTTVDFPNGMEIRSGDLIYKVLDAHLEPSAPGSLALKLDARLTNNQARAVSFWDDQFRLVIDGVLRTPETYLNEAVNGHSSMDRTVEFIIPDTLTETGLQMGKVGEGMPTLPVVLRGSVDKD